MNDTIATGHVMRCLAIADAAKHFGMDTVFIFADDSPVEFVKTRGYNSIVLGSDWSDMLSEVPALIDIIQKKKITKLIVDSYSVTNDYFNAICIYTEVYYIDDIGETVYNVAGIICYGLQYERLDFERRYNGKKLLLGTDYTPLRPEFVNCNKKEIHQNVRNLLIMSGGTDPYEIISKVLNLLERQSMIDDFDNVWAICGRYNKNFDRLTDKFEIYKQVNILKSVCNINEYMSSADIAISAGGTTTLELCATGTPTIVYSMAENQEEYSLAMAEKHLLVYAGNACVDKEIGFNIVEKLKSLMSDYENRRNMSVLMQRLVDGNGAMRIVKNLI